VTFLFTVRVTDLHSEHRTSAGTHPTGLASVAVQILPSLDLIVAASAPDPCAGATFCQNGGACQATLDSTSANVSMRTYSLGCSCPRLPTAFYGAICEFSIFTCANCLSPFLGGAAITLYGISMDTLFSVLVSGVEVEFTQAVYLNASRSDEERQMLAGVGPSLAPKMEKITFLTPALVSNNTNRTGTVSDFSTSALLSPTARLLLVDGPYGGAKNPPSAYKVITLRSYAVGKKQNEILEVNYTNLLFYSSASCSGVGVFREDGLGGCEPCPVGGYCQYREMS
jgi:hypothetical protein